MSYSLFVLIIVANGHIAGVDTFPTKAACEDAELAVVQEFSSPVAASCWVFTDNRPSGPLSESKKK